MYAPLSTSTSASSVLADLAGDSWFQAQHDVLTVTAAPTLHTLAATVTVPGAFDAYDAWAGDLSEVHAFLAAHPVY